MHHLRRKVLPISDAELMAMASAAIKGGSRHPVTRPRRCPNMASAVTATVSVSVQQ